MANRKSELFRFLAAGLALSSYMDPLPPSTEKPKEPKKDIHPKGVKKFIIDNQEIWALNKKNAIRKFKNQKEVNND